MRQLVPTCHLVREAASARADMEHVPLSDAEIDGHLSRCAGCRDFVAGVHVLSGLGDHEPHVQPPKTLIPALAAVPSRSHSLGLAIHVVTSRLHHATDPRRVPLALAAMALGIGLPVASAGVFAHFDNGPASSSRCAVLLDHPGHPGRPGRVTP